MTRETMERYEKQTEFDGAMRALTREMWEKEDEREALIDRWYEIVGPYYAEGWDGYRIVEEMPEEVEWMDAEISDAVESLDIELEDIRERIESGAVM